MQIASSFVMLVVLTFFSRIATAAEAPAPTLSVDSATITLNEQFRSIPHWRSGFLSVKDAIKSLRDPSFSWAAGYIWNHPPVSDDPTIRPSNNNSPAWTSNGTADADPNGDMIARLGDKLSPLTWAGTLDFVARPMPQDLARTVGTLDPKEYLSGTISSFPFAQQYGVFSIMAELPEGHGLWPAFWLVPADKSWPPEIDIMEVIGRDPQTLYTTVHTNEGGHHRQFAHAFNAKLDLTKSFHEYSVDWGPETISWYFDKKLVFSRQTPSDLHKPCYIIANLAVGKSNSWGGEPDATTQFPATMHVSYIKAWQRAEYTE